MHSHPAGVLVFLTDGEGTFEFPDGSSETFRWKAGSIEWVPAMTHLPSNTGSAAYELIFVELRNSSGSSAPADEAMAAWFMRMAETRR